MQAFNGKKWEKFNSEKVASLAYARIQGKAALVTHFQNSSLMNEDKRCRPILFHSEGQETTDQVMCLSVFVLQLSNLFLALINSNTLYCFLMISMHFVDPPGNVPIQKFEHMHSAARWLLLRRLIGQPKGRSR